MLVILDSRARRRPGSLSLRGKDPERPHLVNMRALGSTPSALSHRTAHVDKVELHGWLIGYMPAHRVLLLLASEIRCDHCPRAY